MQRFERVGVVADSSAEAQTAKAELVLAYPSVIDMAHANAAVDVIVVLGGDGFMLQTLHRFIDRKTPLYGMNCGTVGFLLNHYTPAFLLQRLEASRAVNLFPLSMYARCVGGREVEALAINEVSLFRESRQAAKIRITVDHVLRIEETGRGRSAGRHAGGQYRLQFLGRRADYPSIRQRSGADPDCPFPPSPLARCPAGT